jgi:signal transduction histidine kinase/Tfp pilus assembly protein PilF
VYNNKLFLIIIISLSCFPLLAQENADSLEKVLAISNPDTSYVNILNKLSKAYRYSNQVQATDYAVQAEKLAEKLGYTKGLALAYHNIGGIYIDKYNNDLALEYFQKSLELNIERHDKKAMADCYGNLGLVYRRLRNYIKALDFHEKSLGLKQALNDSIGISYSYGNLGIIFMEQGKYDLALEYFYKSLRLKERLNDKYGMANSYGNIGIVYQKIGSDKRARESFERSLEMFRLLNNQSGIAGVLLYLSDIYLDQGDSAIAEESLKRSLEIVSGNANIKEMANVYLKLGQLYAAKKQDFKAYQHFKKSLEHFMWCKDIGGQIMSTIEIGKYFFRSGQTEKAGQLFSSALKQTVDNGFPEEELILLNLLSDYHYNNGEFKLASGYLVRMKSLSDTLNKVNLMKKVGQLEARHEFENTLKEAEFQKIQMQKEHELKMKQNRIERNFYIVVLLLVLVFLGNLLRTILIIKRKNTLLAEQKKALEKANATKDKFMSIIGHDLRTPFNAIIGITTLLSEHYKNMESQNIEEYISLIKEAGENAQGLLENLLDWAQSQSKELKTTIERVSINQLLHGNYLLVQQNAAQRKLTVIEKYSDMVLVSVDKNMINTVVRNLLSNALKFTPEGGTITIVSIKKPGCVEVKVSDNGVGISEEDMGNLFVPGTTKKGKDGAATSGLGILLCKEFLSRHQSELKVESEEGKGSTFSFELPL